MKHRASVPDALEAELEAGLEAGTPAYAHVATVGRHAWVESPTPAADVGEQQGRPEALGAPEEAQAAELTRSETGPALPAYVIPQTALWKSRHLGRILLSIVTAAALVAVVPAGVYYWQMRTDERMHLLVTTATFAIGLWSLLASRRPQVVSLRGSVLTVRGRQVDEAFDLADALQRVEISGQPRQLRWSLRLARVDNTDLVLGKRDVDAIQLDPIVRYYRDLAERRRDRHWSKLGLGAGAARRD